VVKGYSGDSAAVSGLRLTLADSGGLSHRQNLCLPLITMRYYPAKSSLADKLDKLDKHSQKPAMTVVLGS